MKGHDIADRKRRGAFEGIKLRAYVLREAGVELRMTDKQTVDEALPGI